jgi:hypothetical protein
MLTSRESYIGAHALGSQKCLKEEDGACEDGIFAQLVRLEVPGVEGVDEVLPGLRVFVDRCTSMSIR